MNNMPCTPQNGIITTFDELEKKKKKEAISMSVFFFFFPAFRIITNKN
jgi:hypothetical protein